MVLVNQTLSTLLSRWSPVGGAQVTLTTLLRWTAVIRNLLLVLALVAPGVFAIFSNSPTMYGNTGTTPDWCQPIDAGPIDADLIDARPDWCQGGPFDASPDWCPSHLMSAVPFDARPHWCQSLLMSVPIDACPFWCQSLLMPVPFEAQKSYSCQTLLMPVPFDARLSLLMSVPFDARSLLMGYK